LHRVRSGPVAHHATAPSSARHLAAFRQPARTLVNVLEPVGSSHPKGRANRQPPLPGARSPLPEVSGGASQRGSGILPRPRHSVKWWPALCPAGGDSSLPVARRGPGSLKAREEYTPVRRVSRASLGRGFPATSASPACPFDGVGGRAGAGETAHGGVPRAAVGPERGGSGGAVGVVVGRVIGRCCADRDGRTPGAAEPGAGRVRAIENG